MATPEVVADVRRGVMRLARRLRSERQDSTLSANKLSVLGLLHRDGPATAGEIAAAEGQLPQSLTRVFAELELEGFISRDRDTADRRAVIVDITESGRDALIRDMKGRDVWLSRALDELTETEVQLLALASGILDRLSSIELDEMAVESVEAA